MAAHALAYVCREHAAAANQNLGHVAVALAFYLFIILKFIVLNPSFYTIGNNFTVRASFGLNI